MLKVQYKTIASTKRFVAVQFTWPLQKEGSFFSLIISIVSDAAAADRTVYARAVRDHFNMLDPTALPFKTGDTIIVRPNGCLL